MSRRVLPHLLPAVVHAVLALSLVLCPACSLLPAPGAAVAAEDAELTYQAGPVRLVQGVRSLRALRDAGVVRQEHDYSCGSAALATLLRYGLDESVDERELLGELLRSLTPDQVASLQRTGLSLTDLQHLAQLHGHRAQGFRIHQSQLGRLARPVIVYVRPGGYDHFAVLKRVHDGKAELADPSLGNVRMPLYRFVDMWADSQGFGVLMAVEPAGGRWPEHYALQVPGG